MVDNSGSSKAQMPSLSQEGGLGGTYSQGGPVGVKLEAVMEQLQRQQQARLEMERKERHMREAHIMYAQQVAAQQAILAAARASGSPLGSAVLGKGLGRGPPGGGHQSRVSNQSSVESEREDEDDRGRGSEEEDDDEEEEMMEDEDGSEEDEERAGMGLEYLRKQTLALQQGVPHIPPGPYPPYPSSSPPAPGVQRSPSPPVRVKQEPEDEDQSPAGPHLFTSPSGQADWAYDEQFKQLNGSSTWGEEADGGRARGEASRDFCKLYELDSDPNRKEFLDDLFAYMQKRGTPVNRIPIMAKQVLDLYMLYKLVTEKGGLVEVINKKIWREITKGLNLPTSITSAAFTLRTQYMKYLYPYECEKKGLSSPGELQAAIDSNRREGRRPSYSTSLFRFSPSPSTAPHILTPPKMHLSSLGGGVSAVHNGIQASPGPSLKKAIEEGSPALMSSRLPMAMALGQQQLARAATLEQLRVKLETGDGPERKMARLAEEQQRLMQQAFQHNLLAMASQVPMNLRLNSAREDKQDLALSISSNGSTSISVSVEVNGTLYSGMLFAQKSAAAGAAASATAPSAGPSGGFGILSSAHSPGVSSSSSKGPSSAEPSTSGSP
ncbi:AT-rich interactive domain-containing protein 3B-like isoform X2 [Anguilla rostrata]|uniref:AT-rich interactive domain-containing protein 3B-like isoform X1 n=1 Tax=Anguilla anguilla TaxID=7936 RepID=UPI0015AF8C76|nr:AT-rich interactive domain-containing protein 3B-like isoform X1 [Anguilla anguilla]